MIKIEACGNLLGFLSDVSSIRDKIYKNLLELEQDKNHNMTAYSFNLHIVSSIYMIIDTLLISQTICSTASLSFTSKKISTNIVISHQTEMLF